MSDDRARIEVLLEEFTAALRRGEAGDVESWAGRHPDLAAEIRELFPTVLAIEGLREETDRSGSGTRIGFGVLDRLGDFRIVREIGRGGMGVVYEAEQESLGRRVAVKVLPPMRDPKRMRRFEREARTAARLHHTNIVPIFGVGEHDGWHYYVMQVIRGVGLDVVLRALRSGADVPAPHVDPADMTPLDAVRMLRTGTFRPDPRSGSTDRASSGSGAGPAPRSEALPLPPDPGPPGHARAPFWRSVADIGRQVAGALAYAHAQGVLHRDVKPANLLLDPHGVVWVTDFGLAKAVGHDGLTLSGDLVGTLQYMAPEQLHGRYDARTDVYGLGLTLYELLTLRPAFADGDRGSLLRKIEQGNPTPPSQVRAGIPHDLETVVLKAIQHDPRHRYQTAAELADDLQRFLEDRPILARRATAAEQLWRWCRRNRAVASLAGIALLAIVGAGAAGWTGYVSTRSALRDAQREADRATQNVDLAMQAFEDVFDRVAGTDRMGIVLDESGEETSYEWYSQATVSGKDAAVLELLLAFYDRFAEQNAGATDLRADTAEAHRRVGFLLLQLRRVEDARRAYERALDLQLGIGTGSEPQRVAVAAIRNDLGRVEMESVDPRAARGEFAAALQMLDGCTSRSARFERARAHEHLGLLSFSRRRIPFDRRRGERAPPDGDRTPPTGDRLPPPDGAAPPPGDRPPDAGANPRIAAMRYFQEAWRLNGELAAEQPDNPAFQLAAARSGRYLALAAAPDRPMAGGVAADLFERSAIVNDTVDRLVALCARHPGIDTYRSELARTYLDFAARMRSVERTWRRGEGGPPDLDTAPGFSPKAAEFATAAVAIAEELHRSGPGVDDHARLLADALELVARVEAARDDGGETALDVAIAALRRAIEVRPVDATVEAMRIVDCRVQLARLLSARGQHAEALEQSDLAVAAVDARHEDRPDVDGDRRKLADVLRAHAEVAEAAGRLDLAVATLERAAELRRGSPLPQDRLLAVEEALALARIDVVRGDVDTALGRAQRVLTSIADGLGDAGDTGFAQRGRIRVERFLRRPFEPLLRELRARGHGEAAERLAEQIRALTRR